MLWMRIILLSAFILSIVGCTDAGNPVSKENASSRKKTAAKESTSIVETATDPAVDSTSLSPGEVNSSPTVEVTADAPSDRSATTVQPLSVSQIIDRFDLRKVALPKNTWNPRRRVGMYECVAKGMTLSEVTALLREQMTSLGCEETSSQEDEDSLIIGFIKSGFAFTAYVRDQEVAVGQSPRVSLVIMNHGNLDCRQLPAPDNSEVKESSQGEITYLTNENVTNAFKDVCAKIVSDGWRELRPLEDANRYSSEMYQPADFFKEGIQLQAIVYANEQSGDKTLVHYAMSASNFELPVPPTARDVRCDDNAGRRECTVPLPMADVVDFYRARFEGLGWQKDQRYGHADEKSVTLVYQRDNDITWVELSRKEDATAVRLKGTIYDPSAD